MFCYKIHRTEKGVVLAVCDRELVGKTIREDPEFIVNENFYYREEGNEKDVDSVLEKCFVGNIVGEKIIEIALKKKLITKENVIMIGNIPHAQYIK
jgi:hypothetical protein